MTTLSMCHIESMIDMSFNDSLCGGRVHWTVQIESDGHILGVAVSDTVTGSELPRFR